MTTPKCHVLSMLDGNIKVLMFAQMLDDKSKVLCILNGNIKVVTKSDLSGFQYLIMGGLSELFLILCGGGIPCQNPCQSHPTYVRWNVVNSE